MKKLRLDLQQIAVESFDLPQAPASRGTVHGRETRRDEPCGPSVVFECWPSYEQPCWWTGDPMQDCHGASDLNPCTDYLAFC